MAGHRVFSNTNRQLTHYSTTYLFPFVGGTSCLRKSYLLPPVFSLQCSIFGLSSLMQVNATKENINFLMQQANVSTACFHELCFICENITFLYNS